ncbi:hypothetical protein Aperf_G00000019410 [Anoplocephala perfoliata]
MSESEYEVEQILDVRIRNGVKEYLLKWEGYDESESTWEPEKNLKCVKLVKKFEKNRPYSSPTSQSREAGRNLPVMLTSDSEVVQSRKEVEKILKMKIHNDKKMYLIKWKGYPESSNTWEFEENLECPDLIREFDQGSNASRLPRRGTIRRDPAEKFTEKTPPIQGRKETKITQIERTHRGRKESLVKSSVPLPSTSTSEPVENISRPDLIKQTQQKEEKTCAHPSRPELPETAPRRSVTRSASAKQSVEGVERMLGRGSERTPNVQLQKRNRPSDLRTESSRPKRRKTSERGVDDEAEQEGDKEADKIMSPKHASSEKPTMTIVGATEIDGQFMFVLKRGEDPSPIYMSDDIVNKKYPQEVIAFYEKNLTFRDPGKG